MAAANDSAARMGGAYILEEQVGFKLRLASQRHTSIFAQRMIADLTTTQFAALAKLYQIEACSQNHLGRLTAMDVATIKGVIDRLKARDLVTTAPDETDRRRSLVTLTPAGRELISDALRQAFVISEETLSPLSAEEQATLIRLLDKIS